MQSKLQSAGHSHKQNAHLLRDMSLRSRRLFRCSEKMQSCILKLRICFYHDVSRSIANPDDELLNHSVPHSVLIHRAITLVRRFIEFVLKLDLLGDHLYEVNEEPFIAVVTRTNRRVGSVGFILHERCVLNISEINPLYIFNKTS